MLRRPEQPRVHCYSYQTANLVLPLGDTRAADNAPDIARRAKLKKKTAKRSSPAREPPFAASYKALLIDDKISNRSS
jgi:hypothetical protein